MKDINPRNYDFLWKVINHTYLFNSIWMHGEYRKRDFIATWRGSDFKTYISKKERRRLSQIGFNLLLNRLGDYTKEVARKEKRANKEFERMKKEKIKSYDNKSLNASFLHAVDVAQNMMITYFWTEYFCYDLAAEKLEEYKERDKDRFKKLQKAVYKMQELKFRQRKYINKFFYGDLFSGYAKEMEKRFKLKKITNYSYQELSKMLKGQLVKPPDRTICVHGKFNNWQDILGKKATKIIRELESTDKNLKYLKGQIGNKGYYIGRVKIIMFDLKTDFNKEINKMKKGQVLVSGSTGPEMIRACRKAGAIVTEEGGITSHAAIVSRELGIPCVIGTKIATTFLKDGDKVEVDANKGIVKKL